MFKKFLISSLRILAQQIIKKYHPKIVGITGSVGKTSTKESTATILETRFNVRKNYKNYNNEIGLPLTIIGIEQSPGKSIFGWLIVYLKAWRLIWITDKKYPEILVLEMGADKPGDIKYLIEIAPCSIGVLTLISHAHTEYFKTIEKITSEKKLIISHLNSDGTAVLNFDNNLVMEQTDATKAEIITYGFKEGADLRATDTNIIYNQSGFPEGLNFKIHYKGSSVPAFLPGFVAEHMISSTLAGLAVGLSLGINLVAGVEALKKQKPIPGHMRLIPGIKNTTLIDDTYNSSPAASRSGLITLMKINIPPGARRFAILGDMLELGVETENAHREIGLIVAELDVDFLITVGEASKQTAKTAKEAGLNDDRIAMFDNSISAGKFLQEKMSPGDLILIKGSQGARMEKIVKEIMAEPLEAPDLLVRQDDNWLKN
ncbi:MAG: UDP-N-acetylmuramoyl-tripeptide--D-alanyl-D-alanine ligase [bacterium]|nr:UDP-N-acetylmuramoyl-tripeptide--D-alanyl-D-alanine ligase [bacterium]